VGEKASEIMKN